MKTITISTINLKGGSAKTSTILNLGGVLHESGRKPLLIDMDPQQSACMWSKQGGDKFPFPVVALEVGNNVKQFKSKLEHLAEKHKANVILFDTPPQLQNEAMLTALLADIVLIPITPSPLDIWACEKAIETIRGAQKERGGLPKIVLIPSRVMTQTTLGKEVNATLKQFKESISPNITLRVSMAEAAIAGLPISLYDPEGHSHNEFKSLMKFVLSNIRK